MGTLRDLFFGDEQENKAATVNTASDNTQSTEAAGTEGTGFEEVRADELVGNIIAKHPMAAQFLMECGMECIFCPASQMESLSDACAVHGIDGEEIVVALNDYLQSHNA
jgi:hydroxylamine reductase